MIIGTAGHIDHGKTALIKALTGIDADRLKEEKERGITIDLGYAFYPLPHGAVLGFIDVPGHERFVHNMLAGATGIDFVLLVVAADDGVMPQTREHMEIIDLLGVKRGAVALTKIDRVESARVAAARGGWPALRAQPRRRREEGYRARRLGIGDRRARTDRAVRRVSHAAAIRSAGAPALDPGAHASRRRGGDGPRLTAASHGHRAGRQWPRADSARSAHRRVARRPLYLARPVGPADARGRGGARSVCAGA